MRFFLTFATLLSAVLVCLSSLPQASAQGVPVISNCTADHQNSFSITLDDGISTEEYHRKVISTFQARDGAKPFFFVNGNNWNCLLNFKSLIQETMRDKSAFYGSHGWAHLHATQVEMPQFRRDVRLLEMAFVKMGLPVPKFFRFPYGEYNEERLAFLKKRGYTAAVQWNQDSYDTVYDNVSQQKKQMSQDFRTKGLSDILFLNHEVKEGTVMGGLLDWEFDKMQKLGKKHINLPKCMHDKHIYRQATDEEKNIVAKWDDSSCEKFEAAYDKWHSSQRKRKRDYNEAYEEW